MPLQFALPCSAQRSALAAKADAAALVKLAACKTLASIGSDLFVTPNYLTNVGWDGCCSSGWNRNTRAQGSPRWNGNARRVVVVVVGTRTRGLSPRPRALEEPDRVRLVQDSRRGGPVVFGEVGDVAHRRVLPAGDRGVEPRRLPPRRRREVGQRAAPEAAALTCVCFCHLPDLDPRA